MVFLISMVSLQIVAMFVTVCVAVMADDRYIINGSITSNMWWREIYLGEEPATNLDIIYNVKLSRDLLHPVHLYFTGWQVDVITKNMCFPASNGIYDTISVFLKSLPVLIPGGYAGCTDQGATRTCKSGLGKQVHTPHKWRVYMGFDCDRTHPEGLKNLHYSFTFSLSNNTGECVKLNNECGNFYISTSFPNAFGHTNMSQAQEIKTLFSSFGLEKIARDCYQHAQKVICLLVFPECKDGQQLQICRSTCLDFLKKCANAYQVQILSLVCESFPESNDPKICFTPHVDCGIPPTPNNGIMFFNLTTLGSEATYNCPSKFTLTGNITRTCELTGQWSGEMPRCIANTLIINEENPVSLIAGLSTTAALLVIMAVGIAVVLIVWQHEVQVIFYAKFGLHCCRTRTDQNKDTELDNRREHDLFLCYANEDRQIALQDLLNLLEGPEFNLKVHVADRDFLPGNAITDNIDMAIAGCSNMLILVSQATIDSDWCIYEFYQGYTRMIRDPSFQLILVVLREPREFHNVPGAMKAYFRTRTYLKYWDSMLADRLRYILHP